MGKKVLLGMSGGVDSSVAAILLKKAGYEVIGATMQLWEKENDTSIEDAKNVCEMLQIEHHVIDFKKEFQTRVIDYFTTCYQCAKTPNPCIECNRYLKFGAFWEASKQFGCDKIATGHYAKIQWDDTYQQYVLKKSKVDKKDQTYFLYNIPKEVIPNILFPLADFTEKTQIRKIAQENGLTIAKKPDSQEVCFIPNDDYGSFLESISKLKPGNIVLGDGTILGKHKGLIFYTIGQRKGLGIAYQEPLYVIKLDTTKNEVIVGTQKDLYQNELYAEELNFLLPIQKKEPLDVKAKVRYRVKEAQATICIQKDSAKVIFKEPQRAITPGQSVVFYKGDIVLGGGKIK